jgi:two-component sensor histidine kinase
MSRAILELMESVSEPLPPLSDLIAAHDWSRSPLGAPDGWSISLRTPLGLMLRSQAQIVLFWGPEFVAVYNDAYAPTIGAKHPHALGRPARECWSELWDDLGPLLRGVLETGETFAAKDRPFYIERHGYGETVYFDVSYSVVPDTDGTAGGVFCIVSETTERVRAQEHLQLVVHELNHRVKNNLAMMQSIALQTFRPSIDVHEAQQRFSQRLVALAQANDLLTGERWAGASLRGAIEQAIAPHQPDLSRTLLAGPEILLSPKTALALTLAAHELATNAVKYGAWSNDSGRVVVEWSSPISASGEPRLHLEWREQGGPPVAAPQERGFGSRLIQRGRAGELNGDVSLVFDPGGVRCTLDCPLETVAEA